MGGMACCTEPPWSSRLGCPVDSGPTWGRVGVDTGGPIRACGCSDSKRCEHARAVSSHDAQGRSDDAPDRHRLRQLGDRRRGAGLAVPGLLELPLVVVLVATTATQAEDARPVGVAPVLHEARVAPPLVVTLRTCSAPAPCRPSGVGKRSATAPKMFAGTGLAELEVGRATGAGSAMQHKPGSAASESAGRTDTRPNPNPVRYSKAPPPPSSFRASPSRAWLLLTSQTSEWDEHRKPAPPKSTTSGSVASRSAHGTESHPNPNFVRLTLAMCLDDPPPFRTLGFSSHDAPRAILFEPPSQEPRSRCVYPRKADKSMCPYSSDAAGGGARGRSDVVELRWFRKTSPDKSRRPWPGSS